jgi:hypothetical protein
MQLLHSPDLFLTAQGKHFHQGRMLNKPGIRSSAHRSATHGLTVSITYNMSSLLGRARKFSRRGQRLQILAHFERLLMNIASNRNNALSTKCRRNSWYFSAGSEHLFTAGAKEAASDTGDSVHYASRVLWILKPCRTVATVVRQGSSGDHNRPCAGLIAPTNRVERSKRAGANGQIRE